VGATKKKKLPFLFQLPKMREVFCETAEGEQHLHDTRGKKAQSCIYGAKPAGEVDYKRDESRDSQKKTGAWAYNKRRDTWCPPSQGGRKVGMVRGKTTDYVSQHRYSPSARENFSKWEKDPGTRERGPAGETESWTPLSFFRRGGVRPLRAGEA